MLATVSLLIDFLAYHCFVGIRAEGLHRERARQDGNYAPIRVRNRFHEFHIGGSFPGNLGWRPTSAENRSPKNRSVGLHREPEINFEIKVVSWSWTEMSS